MLLVRGPGLQAGRREAEGKGLWKTFRVGILVRYPRYVLRWICHGGGRRSDTCKRVIIAFRSCSLACGPRCRL